MSIVRCHIDMCKYNKSGFCKNDFVVIIGGFCNQLMNKDGSQKDPQEWVKPEILQNMNQQK